MAFALAMACVGLTTRPAAAHDGPDPAGRWHFEQARFNTGTLKAMLGPDLTLSPGARFAQYGHLGMLLLDGQSAPATVNANKAQLDELLPKEAFTISAWVSVDSPKRWGGIVGYLQDNADAETGWVLGYDNEHFTIGLSTQEADDGDGKMTYLTGKTAYTKGKFHHVAAVYDGQTLSLFVDGALDASTQEQSGPILYPTQPTVMTIGAYRDINEDIRHHGRISSVTLYHDAATAKWVAEEFGHRQTLAKLDLERVEYEVDPSVPQQMLVKPFLQAVDQTSITVTWETTRKSNSTLFYGETAECERKIVLKGEGEQSARGFVQQQRITDLKKHTQYFYRVESISDNGQKVSSEVRTFQTAPDAQTPFAFAVISDTQGNLPVAGKVSELALSERPSFVLHAGDLVSTGSNKRHWTDTFFPSMEPLISRAAIFPVLGNHEADAEFYYQYMDLPKPEYYYTFTYGNAQFFMIDTNRNVGSGSEQYAWLEKQLKASRATWKIVCHHHPPYSSDENDYGNLWKTNQSTRGDLRARELTTLYDRYKVDIVWTGHIHTYERTWPMRNGKPTERGGTLYMVTGGGGGGLENPGPFRTAFSNVVHRDHHYAMVHVNGKHIETRVYDVEGQLFDTFTLDKQ
jgi:predicted phosphodiesterase